MENNLIDNFVRDITKVGSIPKSEVRRRLEEIIKQTRTDTINEILDYLPIYDVSVGKGRDHQNQLVGVNKLSNQIKDKLIKMRDERN